LFPQKSGIGLIILFSKNSSGFSSFGFKFFTFVPLTPNTLLFLSSFGGIFSKFSLEFLLDVFLTDDDLLLFLFAPEGALLLFIPGRFSCINFLTNFTGLLCLN